MTIGNRAQVPPAAPKHFAFVEFAVVVSVFQDDNAVRVLLFGCFGMGVVFYDPQSTPIIKVKRDGSTDIWFACKQRNIESRWYFHQPKRLQRCQRNIARILAIGNTIRQIVSSQHVLLA